MKLTQEEIRNNVIPDLLSMLKHIDNVNVNREVVQDGSDGGYVKQRLTGKTTITITGWEKK